ncbi:MAG: enamine deaminase RidA (YjgF/YER057c/UK114 family) [Gammaproteobacteria bacterium]|jgi:enamine deaminase RidA (YjgF/YER057c/UK114 family)
MSNQSLQPDALFRSADFGFAQVVSAEGKKLIFCAGQTAWDKELNIIGGDDLALQMEKTLENVGHALKAAGGSLKDVVRLTIYIVNYNPDQLDTIAGVLGKFFDKDALPANTLLGIQSLALPDFLVEIEATAVV